jgi:hypothetical protein
MKLHCNGAWLDVPDDATARSVTSRLDPAKYGDWVIVHEGRLLDPDERLASLGYRDGATVSVADDRCTHGSPLDPRTGYACGWC